MDLPSVILSRLSGPRTGSAALSSALVVLPAFVAWHPRAGALLLAFSAVAAAVLLERRAHAASRAREARRLAPVSSPVRPRPARVAPQMRWEVVERDGQSSVCMRWD